MHSKYNVRMCEVEKRRGVYKAGHNSITLEKIQLIN